MKSTISENGASVMVLDSVFKQADSKYSEIWENLNKLLAERGAPPLKQGFSQFAFTIAVTSVNMRTAYDIFPRDKAERLFVHTMHLFEMQLKNPTHLAAVTNSIRKYITAYNDGLTAVHNPLDHVAHLLYYNMGMKNVGTSKAGQSSVGANPGIVKYLASSMLFFSGKWEALNGKFDILNPENEL